MLEIATAAPPTSDPENHAPDRTEDKTLAVLPDLTEQLEQSLLSIFERDQRKDSDVDTACPFGLVAPAVVDEPPDDQPLWAEPLAGHEGPVLQIIDWQAAETALEIRQASALTQDARRITNLTAALRARGTMRKLATVKPTWRTDLEDMARQFPNFVQVVDYLRGMFALASHGDGVPMLAPMLFVGPPGVGKTYFAMHLAKYFGSGFQTVHIETAQTSSVLSGSDEHWGNTKTGAVFNAIVEGEYANPVFFLDEIDKAFEGEHDPLMSLYCLLESETAMVFTDASYPWLPGIDASHIVWICTCNEVGLVPAPLLDRLRRFDIAGPTASQGRQIVQSLMARLAQELPENLRGMRLTRGALDVLMVMSPRQARAALLEAIGMAAYRQKMCVSVRDIVIDGGATQAASRIGFLD